MCKPLVAVPQVTFAYVSDAGPFRVRKYESVIMWLGTSVKVVSERTDSKLVGFASLLLVAGQQ